MVGVVAMTALAVGQILIRPKTYIVEHTSELPREIDLKPAVAVVAPVPANQSQKSREVELLSGKVVFDAGRFPGDWGAGRQVHGC